jgi:hypothetical protein
MAGWSDSPTLLMPGISLSAQSSPIFHSLRLIDVLREVPSACTVVGTWTYRNRVAQFCKLFFADVRK